MSQLATIMDELANSIRDTLDDVTDVAVQVEGKLILNATPPTIDIYPADAGRDDETAAFGELAGGYLLSVRARVSTADHDAGQSLLLAMMDDDDELSLGAAIEGDVTLGGWAYDVAVRSRTGFVIAQDPGADAAYLAAIWTVLVIPARS